MLIVDFLLFKIFILAFAIIMLNTDLHTQALKPEKRMRCEDFIKNLRGVDDCTDIDRDILVGIYERVKVNEFKPASDHVSQVCVCKRIRERINFIDCF
jgi:IQ motif and SEC7 domain-containing protein